jgi:hypothetical protein
MKLTSILFLILFILGLAGGYRMSSLISFPSPITGPKTIQEPAVEGLPALANGQRSIMMVIVDDLQKSEPDLMSIWLVLYVPPNPHLTLMPMFPLQGETKAGLTAQLAEEFEIHGKNEPPRLSDGFQTTLRRLGFWWSGYILMDMEALEQAASLFPSDNFQLAGGGASPSPSSKPGGSAQPFELTRPTGPELLYKQAVYFQSLCWQASLSEQPSPEQIRDHFDRQTPNHLNLDFDLNFLIDEIQLLRSHTKSLECEIPLIDYQAITSQ